jgi:DNA-binding LacI/PurR family transcriptional regulator
MGRVATEMMMTLLAGGTPRKPDLFTGRLVKRGTVYSAV